MRIIVILSILLITSCRVDEKLPKSFESKLIGTWKSDSEKTKNYNDKHSKLADKQREFLTQLTGKMSIEYRSDGTWECLMPDYTLAVGDKKIHNQKSTQEGKYKILGFDADSIVIESTDEIFDKMIYRLHFEDDNTYWIYLSEGVSDLHAREYFTKTEKAEQKLAPASGQ